MDEKNLIEFYGQDVPRQSTNADWYAHQIAIVNKRNAELEQHHQAQQERIDALESELAQAKREIDGLTQEIPKCGNPLHAACKCHGCTEIGTKPDCLTCEAEASLQSAQETLQGLRKVASELTDAMETCHICKGTVLVEEQPVHCEDCSWDCDNHEGSECPTLYGLHLALKNRLTAINPPAPKEPQ